MHKHSSLERGNELSANESLWPDYAIEADPYRLPAHIEFEVPNPVFSSVPANRTVSIYKGFVVVTDKLGQHSTAMRIIALDEFDAVVVRVGFSSHGYRQIGSAVYLHHEKYGLDLPLYASNDCQDTASFWLSWSRVLGVPAMSVNEEGELSDPFERVGELHVGTALQRRSMAGNTCFRPAFRRQSAVQQRRLVDASAAKMMVDPRTGVRKNESNVYRLFS